MKEEKKIKICVFTGTRADYGILSRLMGEIKKGRDFKLQIIASGAHLSVRHGCTIKEIESDGFLVDKKVEILLSSDTPSGVAKSMALGVMGFSEALGELKSDLAVVLGDRYEAMAMAAAAVMHNIPLVHIHGGELTQGSMDEMFRHAITKMSRLHFVSTEEYRLRVIQMGETPDFVYNVGAPG
ncbi:MAG TPA: UDP-N-acetylglucosamine 2-epimerase, partial [Candidatus Wallbacteria bacterium]|nr:UDP-N-acetylglucosamine 2-epimerase [Candidatus Wallbacteria bacterium]